MPHKKQCWNLTGMHKLSRVVMHHRPWSTLQVGTLTKSQARGWRSIDAGCKQTACCCCAGSLQAHAHAVTGNRRNFRLRPSIRALYARGSGMGALHHHSMNFWEALKVPAAAGVTINCDSDSVFPALSYYVGMARKNGGQLSVCTRTHTNVSLFKVSNMHGNVQRIDLWSKIYRNIDAGLYRAASQHGPKTGLGSSLVPRLFWVRG